MKNDRVVVFRSFRDAIRGLPDDVRLEILEAIIDYGLDGTTPNFKNQISRSIFLMAQPNIDVSDSKRKKRGNPNFGKGRPNPYYKGDNSGDNSGDNLNPIIPPQTPINSIIPDNSEIIPQGIGIGIRNIGIGKGIELCDNSYTPAHARIGDETFGYFKNVFLKPAEYRQLEMEFGKEILDETIENLSNKIAEGKETSINHYATLRHWCQFQKKKQQPHQPKGRDLIGSDDEFTSD